MNSKGRIDFWIMARPVSSTKFPEGEQDGPYGILWIRYVSSFPLEEIEGPMADASEFFDAVVLSPKDYEGLTVEEAYRVGMEMGCFVQSVAIAQNMGGDCAIRIPSDRADRAAAFLKESGIEYTINWINDDVMVVRLIE